MLIGFILLCTISGYSQITPKLCICFDEDTKYISIGYISGDSTFAGFSIVREGYETEEKRKKAKKRHQKKFPHSPHITMYYNFYAVMKPVKINSIKAVDECIEVVTVNEYRQDEFKEPENASDGLFIFIKKLPDGTFLKWKVAFMPYL